MNAKRRRYFQYLIGERQGEVLTLDKIEEDEGMIFVSFKDKSRCNKDLILPLNNKNRINQLMAEVDSPHNIWTFKEEWEGRQKEETAKDSDGNVVVITPAIYGKKKKILIPPPRETIGFTTTFEKEEDGDQQSFPDVPLFSTVAQPDNDNPVWLMLSKAKKFDTKIEMDIIVSLPAKALYNVIKESFEDGDEKTIEYIISNLDDQKIKDSLRSSLKEAYEDVSNEG